MGTPADAGAPMAWFPATVGAAYRRGAASDEDLMSGRAFEDMLAGLRRAAEMVGSARGPSSSVDRAAGYRHLLVLLALAVDEALRPSDPYDPCLRPGQRRQRPQVGHGLPRRRLHRRRHPPRRHLPHQRPSARRSAISASRSCRASPTSATSWPTTSTSAPTAASRSSCRPRAPAGQLDGPVRGAPPRWSSASSSTTGTPSMPAVAAIECLDAGSAGPGPPTPSRRPGWPASCWPWGNSSRPASPSGWTSRKGAGPRG